MPRRSAELAANPPVDEWGDWLIPLSDVRLPEQVVQEAATVLRGGWLSMGPRVQEFETAFATYVSCAHAVACSSGTAALQLALACAGVRPGDEVVIPSLTFVAAANAARALGAEPIFADVAGADDLTLDPRSVEAVIGDRTRAIMPMHYGGWPAAAEIAQIARDSGVALVEDAAHALGAASTLGRCGSWGTAGCFSFFSNKNLPLGEGGMLTTNDAELAAHARRLRSQGTTASTWDRHRGLAIGYDVTDAGYSFRFDEMRAAMGSLLLRELDGQIERRGRLVKRYRDGLATLDRIELPFTTRPLGEHPAHHLATVLLPSSAERDAVAAYLRHRRIQTNVHYRPIHHLAAYATGAERLPETEALASRILTLPLFAHMTEDQVDQVVSTIAAAVERLR